MDNKDNKQWVWLALDADTGEIVGAYIGARDEAAARALWQSLPPIYRQCAVTYTDFWAAYAAVLPSQRHRAVGKETGNFGATLNGSTTPLDNGCLGWYEKLYPFLSPWIIILVPSGISSTITMHHYLFSTTNKVSGNWRYCWKYPRSSVRSWFC